MDLPLHEAHIWCFTLDEVSHLLEWHSGLLCPDELTRAHKFKFDRDRRIYSHARALLRVLSGLYLDRKAASIQFKYGAYGKPDYDFPSPIKFNISHSGELMVLAFVRNSEIGVDVEKIKVDFDVLDIAENFFSSDEIVSLRAIPEDVRADGFYRCWTRKESFIKAKGSGLSFPLASFSVSLDDTVPELLKTKWNPKEKEDWNLYSFRPHADYLGALSVQREIRSVSYLDWNAYKGLF